MSVLAKELQFKTYYWRKDRIKNGNDGKDKEGDASSYQRALRKRENTVNWKRNS